MEYCGGGSLQDIYHGRFSGQHLWLVQHSSVAWGTVEGVLLSVKDFILVYV